MTSDAVFPVVLSLEVAAAALALAAPLGLALAVVQAKTRYRLRGVVDALILLPLVLPPSVTGFVLVMLLGRRGVLGATLDHALGVRLAFTPAAAVIAASIVALPLIVKTAQPALEAVPRELEDVARTLGLAPREVMLRVTFRHAWRGVLASVVLGFARALGEFGATLMFAGNVPGRTNTMPLEIWSAYQSGEDVRAGAYVAVLTALTLGLTFAAGRGEPRVTR